MNKKSRRKKLLGRGKSRYPCVELKDPAIIVRRGKAAGRWESNELISGVRQRFSRG